MVIISLFMGAGRRVGAPGAQPLVGGGRWAAGGGQPRSGENLPYFQYFIHTTFSLDPPLSNFRPLPHPPGSTTYDIDYSTKTISYDFNPFSFKTRSSFDAKSAQAFTVYTPAKYKT